MADGDTEIITLSSDDESKSKTLTSPKLSLRRKRDDISPENKNSEASFSPLSKKVKLFQPDFASVNEEPLSSISTTQAYLSDMHKEEENKKKFMEFLEYSKTLMEETSEEEKATIVKRLVHQLDSTQRWYISSNIFKSVLEDSWNKLREDSSNIFPVLYEMKQNLKKFKCKLKSTTHVKESDVLCKQSSISFSNSINNGNALFSPSTSNDSRSFSESNKNSCSKNNSEVKNSACKNKSEEKTYSQSASLFSVHSIQKVGKSDSSSHIITEEVVEETKATTSVSALVSESFQNSVLNKNSIEKVSDFVPVASTSGLCSFKETKENNLEKIVISDFKSLSSPSYSSSSKSNDVSSFGGKDDQKHLFPLAATLGLCPSVVKPVNNSEKKEYSDFQSLPSTSYASPSGYDDVKSIRMNDDKHMDEQNKRQAARIKKLETFLGELDKAIKKMQKKELNLDDLDNPDSAYIKEERYKNRFNRVYKKLCQLKKCSTRTGRIVEKRFHYEGSRYKQINLAIERLIDKKKAYEKFPDFSEVLSSLKQVNESHQIGLSEKDILVEAERVFKDVGLELQDRRCRDDKELFGCYLTDDFSPIDDPAEKDENLKNTLDENDKLFEASINQIIDNYAEQQKKMANSGEANQEESDDDDDDEEDDDDDDEEDDEEDEETQEKAYIVNDMEDDLPLTDPASPDVGARNKSSDEEVMEIRNESDKSTEPTDEIEEIIIKKERLPSIKTAESRVLSTVVIEDSSSSSSGEDLPSIDDLINR